MPRIIGPITLLLSCLSACQGVGFPVSVPLPGLNIDLTTGTIDKIPKNPLFLPEEKCYDALGCFSTGGNFNAPLIRPFQLPPQGPDVIRPTYALYTKRNIVTPQYLEHGKKPSVTESNFNATLPTKIIIHGFLASGQDGWVVDMKKAFLLRGDCNVIQLDWSKGNGIPYMQATANTRVVGALIAQLIQWLEAEFKANREGFHLLGHSLGSHIAGYAGERLREASRQLGRITGLDPAGPYFEGTHPDVRLDPTDARFVDAIHTDGDSILSTLILEGGFGMMQPVGHVDFYPNGGKKQPACDKSAVVKIVVSGLIDGTKWVITCDHSIVNALMTSTIQNPSGDYKAYPCNSYEDFKLGHCSNCGAIGCAQMGLRADEWDAKGQVNVKMFLDTADTEPHESTGHH